MDCWREEAAREKEQTMNPQIRLPLILSSTQETGSVTTEEIDEEEAAIQARLAAEDLPISASLLPEVLKFVDDRLKIRRPIEQGLAIPCPCP